MPSPPPVPASEYALLASAYGPVRAEACHRGECEHPQHPAADPPAPATSPGMVDLRCPESMGKLLGRARATTSAAGLIDLACNNCARNYRRAGMTCSRVIHRYNLLGELLATEITP